MAEIDFKCPECNKSVKSDDSLCGEFMTCPSCSSEIIIPIPGLTKGMKLGDFEIIEKLGSGSMGEVWLAYQATMDRKVALKILAPKYGSDSKFIDRFMSEVKHSAKLAHPNIVTAFYAGTDKGHYYLAISYVTGKTVEDLQAEEGKFEEKKALKIILSIVDALEYAWNEFKILHRDIKPGNIMIDKRGEAMLLDLGIAKSLDEESNLTMTGTVVGTPFYISPEQAMALTDIDFRADIYSLGITLYHMVTGTVPYNATTAMAIIMKHINDDLPEPGLVNPDLSPGCCELIKIMMSKEREQRQRSWGELRKDIELVLAGKIPDSAAPSDETTFADKPEVKKVKKGSSEKAAKHAEKTDKPKKFLIAGVAVAVVILLFFALIGGGLLLYFSTGDKQNASKIVGPPVTPNIEVKEDSAASIYSAVPDKPVNNKAASDSIEMIENPYANDPYNKFCEELLHQTSLTRKTFWVKHVNEKVSWSGEMVDVKGRPGKYELHLNNKSRGTYKGFNIILVSYTSDGSVPALRIGDNVKFTGNLYNFRLKANNVVIPYVKNVIIDSSKR